MATKQGLTAQLSQASEDAKRAVLQRSTAVIKSSSQWFSNLNTTCTIKSAPPRTPDVLQMLSVKSGFLYKRNEQHVWQARWCCVVPHMFMYYFDAIPLPQARGNPTSTALQQNQQQQQPQLVTLPPPPPTVPQQDAWNTAVRNGYDGGRGKQGPRSSLYHVFPTNGGTGAPPEGMTTSSTTMMMMMPSTHNNPATMNAMMDTSETMATATSTSLPTPAGIIDLECYTSVHRSNQNPLVLELAGDDSVNPDLRGFYFVAKDEDEAEDWTQALLSQRHSQLLDERDAYQQVCDGFALQLQELHSQLDACQVDLEQAREEVYSVRCQMEDQRRSCWKLVEEALEQQQQQSHANDNKANRSNNLEEIRAQDGSSLASVQLLLDYTKSLEETCAQLQQSNIQLQQEKETAQHANLKEDHSQETAELQCQLHDCKSQYQRLQDAYHAERLVWQQDTSAQKATMQQYKTKLKEMQAHKKILKREVIELRKKCEEMESEVNLLQHRHGKELQHEQSKLELLERYLAKMESQVKVQQNMMEMMSSSMSYYGGGSLYGGEGAAVAGGSLRGGPMELPRSIVAPRVYPPPPPLPTAVSNEHAAALAAAMNDDSVNTTLMSDTIVPDPPSNNNNDEQQPQKQQQQLQLDNTAKTNVVTTSVMLPPTTPRRIPTQSVPTQQQQQQQEGMEESFQQQDEDDFRRSNYTNSNNLAVSALADDMDNKSHLSELTEDRTQRQFDFVFHHRQQQRQQQEQDSTGPKGTARLGNSLTTSPNNASPSPRNTTSALEGPPSYIMGGMDKSAAAVSSSQQPLPHHAHLDTITSRAASTPNINAAPSTSPTSPTRQQNVAHRSKMNADKKAAVSMKLRAPIVPTNSSPKKVRARTTSGAASVASNASGRGDRSIGSAGSFLSNLGKRLEQALDNSILGVPDISTESSLQSKDFYEEDDDDDDDDDDDPFHQYRRGRAAFEEKKVPEGANVKVPNHNSKRSPPPPSLQTATATSNNNNNASSTSDSAPVNVDAAVNAAAAAAMSPKSVSPSGGASHHSGLSLQERQKLQRAKQLAFLKQQGIIRKDDEVRGGAGGGGNSVSSSPSTWIDSTVSLGTTTTNPSTSTQSVQHHRPHNATGPRRAVAR